MKKYTLASFASLGLLLIILDTKTALFGAQEGIRLCLQCVIPSLFPFFILSGILTSSLMGQSLKPLKGLSRFLRIPEGSESLLLVGLIGGYPAGAQAITQAWTAGSIKKQDAHRMLGFCSNAGPAFLFGIGSQLFSTECCWILWLIHILSAWITALIIPGESNGRARLPESKPITMPAALSSSLRITAQVCGWVVLFRIVITFLEYWVLWFFPPEISASIVGFLELSNGCLSLNTQMMQGLKFILFSCFLGFGGICVAMQTVSVTEPLGTGWYFPGKVMQLFISFFLAYGAQFLLFPEECWHSWGTMCCAMIAFSAMFAGIRKKTKIYSRIPGKIPV